MKKDNFFMGMDISVRSTKGPNNYGREKIRFGSNTLSIIDNDYTMYQFTYNEVFDILSEKAKEIK